jgi:hypothetical protein
MRRSKVLLSAAAVLALVFAVGCGKDKGSDPDKLPGEFGVELETFADRNDTPGSATIQKAYCGGASGDYQVIGMDAAGEWIKVPFHVDEACTYEPHVVYQAEDVPIHVAMTIEGCADTLTVVSFTLNQHAGIG